jgi:hypothetical protein
MKRLNQALNRARATLWVDRLRQGGLDVGVQRTYASSITGEIPPDQALPEVWVDDLGSKRYHCRLKVLPPPPLTLVAPRCNLRWLIGDRQK